MRQRRLHLHAIAVHFANGVIPTSLLFLGLFFLLEISALEMSAFYTLVVGTLGLIATTLTGLREWRQHYRSAWVPIFQRKLALALIALASGALACYLRTAHPDLLLEASALRLVYLALNLICLAAAGTAGYLGGRLVFH